MLDNPDPVYFAIRLDESTSPDVTSARAKEIEIEIISEKYTN